MGGPTAILEIGGLRLLTDPAFDPLGEYLSGSGILLTKTRGPALRTDDVGSIDAVLLSHDQRGALWTRYRATEASLEPWQS